HALMIQWSLLYQRSRWKAFVRDDDKNRAARPSERRKQLCDSNALKGLPLNPGRSESHAISMSVATLIDGAEKERFQLYPSRGPTAAPSPAPSDCACSC